MKPKRTTITLAERQAEMKSRMLGPLVPPDVPLRYNANI
jgi:hypothetical protein